MNTTRTIEEAGQKLLSLLIKKEKLFFFNNYSKSCRAFVEFGTLFEGFVINPTLTPVIKIEQGTIKFKFSTILPSWSYKNGRYTAEQPWEVNGNFIEFPVDVNFIDDISEHDLESEFRLLASEEQVRNSVLSDRFSVALDFAKVIFDYEEDLFLYKALEKANEFEPLKTPTDVKAQNEVVS